MDRIGESLSLREKERGELSIWVRPPAQHSNRPQRDREESSGGRTRGRKKGR